MLGKSHFLMGACEGAAMASLLPVSIEQKVLFGFCCATGSLLPDIDHPTSTIGSMIKPISKLVNRACGHRGKNSYQKYVGGPFQGLMHSPFMGILLSGIIYYVTRSSAIAGGILAGWICHLLQDMMTISGIPLLYPLIRRNIHILALKSGSLLEIPVTLVLGIGLYIVSKPTIMTIINIFKI